jgi:predicted RNA-binding protein
MCEFTVILEGKEVFKDVVYAKMEGGKVILRDVLGESMQLSKCRIVEVDVNSTRLVLSHV